MPTAWFVLLVSGASALVGVVIWLLLKASAEEEQRATEAWERAISEPRRVRDRNVWSEDDDAA